jgi:hypothetical protein
LFLQIIQVKLFSQGSQKNGPMMRSSQKDKLVTPPAKAPPQAADGIDRLRDVFFRNDCVAQASELSLIVDNTQMGTAAEVKPLPELPVTNAARWEGVEWLVDLEQGNDRARETQKGEAQAKLKVLQEEHDSRIAERARIVEKELAQKLEKEHTLYK